jgi:hypothetical protein
LLRRLIAWSAKRAWLRDVFALLLYAALAVGMFSSAIFSGGSAFAGGEGDSEQFIWYMQYGPWSLLHGHLPFFTSWIVYPQGANLMWNTSIILPSLVLSPITLAFGPIAAWDVLEVAAVAISAWAAYMVLRRFCTYFAARLVGGLAYGFSAYMVNQSLGHAQLNIAWYPPVLLLLLDAILFRPAGRRRWLFGIALGVATAAQLLTGEELLATSALCALILLIVVAAFNTAMAFSRARRALPTVGLAVGVFALLSAYPLEVQFFGPQKVPEVFATSGYVADLANFLVPSPLQEFSTAGSRQLSSAFDLGSVPEIDGYLGLPLLLAIPLAAFLARRNRPAMVALVTTALIALLALGPRLHIAGQETAIRLPWTVIQRLPLLKSVAPVRLMLFVALGVAVLLGIALDIAMRNRQRWQQLGLVSAAVIAVVPLTPVVPYPKANAAVPQYFSSSGDATRLPEGTVLMIAPYAYPYRAALWQATSGMRFRMTEGMVYVPGPGFGSEPSVLRNAMEAIEVGAPLRTFDAAALSLFREVLVDDGVDEVVVGPFDNAAVSVPTEQQMDAADPSDLSSPVIKVRTAVAFLTAVIGRPPQLLQGVYVWQGVKQGT